MIYPETSQYLWILGRFLAQRQINKVPDDNVNTLFKSRESQEDFFSSFFRLLKQPNPTLVKKILPVITPQVRLSWLRKEHQNFVN